MRTPWYIYVYRKSYPSPNQDLQVLVRTACIDKDKEILLYQYSTYCIDKVEAFEVDYLVDFKCQCIINIELKPQHQA